MHILRFISVQNQVPSVDCLSYSYSRCPLNKQLKHVQTIRSGNSISGKQINEIQKIISMYPLFVYEQLHVHCTNFEKKN